MDTEITNHIDSLNDRAWQLRSTSQEESLQLAGEALDLAQRENYKPGMATALLTLTVLHDFKGDSPAMIGLAERAFAIGVEIGDKSIEARSSHSIGMACLKTDDYDKALKHVMHAIAIYEETGEKNRLGHSLNAIGTIYRNMGQYDKALDYYMRSLVLFEENSNDDGLANVKSHISYVYSLSGDLEKALEYQLNALALQKELKNKRGVAASLVNIGVIYYQIDRYDTALEYSLRALALQQEVGDKHGIAMAYMGLGNVYRKIDNYEDALKNFNHSLEITRQIGAKSSEAGLLSNMGEIYLIEEFSGHNPDTAITYLKTAVQILQEINFTDYLIISQERLSKAFEYVRDWEQSLVHFKRFHQIKEEVHNEVASKKIANFETERKFYQIEKERELERREQKAVFKILNRVLPRQIVDRVKNGEENIADKFPSASVLFADIVGFTPLAERLGADEVLKLLSGIFSHFDNLCEKFGCEKIKTVGDSYMVASGVPVECEDHYTRIAHLAIAMQEDVKLNLNFTIPELSIRIGIHTGEVIAGVLGTHKLSYDIWGDTVNTAARMESTSEPDMIHCTEAVYELLKDTFTFKERGEMEIKGKGRMKTYFLLKEIF